MGIDIEHLREWIGRTERVDDIITPAPIQALAATLDHDDAHTFVQHPLRPCWHWLYFLPLHRQSSIGTDGHPLRGGFLPPVPLPRRMWAGSQLRFLAPLRAGHTASLTSRIADVQVKEGKSGTLVFVKVNREISVGTEVCVSETQDLVYRDMPTPGQAPVQSKPAPAAAAPVAEWSREIVPDEVLLFRYSALTFNGHRIHYDRPYATGVEEYPGLVVHGPLIATLLLDLLARNLPRTEVREFTFKATQPIFDTAPFHVHGRMEGEHTVHLWAVTRNGNIAMQATAHIS